MAPPTAVVPSTTTAKNGCDLGNQRHNGHTTFQKWQPRSTTGTMPTKSPEFEHVSLTSLNTGTDTRNPAPYSSTNKPTMAALSTPHDALLAELQGTRTPPISAGTSVDIPPKLSIRPSLGGSAERESEGTPSASGTQPHIPGGLRSSSSSPRDRDTTSEPVFDPFSGASAGVFRPRPPAHPQKSSPSTSRERERNRQRDREEAYTRFDEAKEELWAHLARIRVLQSEIAGMHAQMEGMGGPGEGRGAKRPPAGGAHSESIGAGEEWGDPEEEERERKKARDTEFTSLAEAFEGRKAAVDGIMGKLDELSKALTTFHALPTPIIDLSSSRNVTKDSNATSPGVYSSSSPLHAGVPSTNSTTTGARILPMVDPIKGNQLEHLMSESPVSSHLDIS